VGTCIRRAIVLGRLGRSIAIFLDAEFFRAGCKEDQGPACPGSGPSQAFPGREDPKILSFGLDLKRVLSAAGMGCESGPQMSPFPRVSAGQNEGKLPARSQAVVRRGHRRHATLAPGTTSSVTRGFVAIR